MTDIIKMKLPEIMNIPPKMLPIISDLKKYRFFVIKGGRGSAKTQSVGRLITYLTDIRHLRVVCGRELQSRIDESVYTVLKDLITEYNLSHKVMKNEIRHHGGSTIKFKGFRDESGNVNAKGVENVDLVWVDEAQSLTMETINTLVPTIVRNEQAKVFFTMNPMTREDAVIEYFSGREDTLFIEMNFYDNPFASKGLLEEARLCKEKSDKEYRHIWLGEPVSLNNDFIFNYDHLYRAYNTKPDGDTPYKQRVMSIDFATGGDNCVATILDRVSMTQWQRTCVIRWDERDATVSVGKIINLIGMYKPDVSVLDVAGSGHIAYNYLVNAGVHIERFNGGESSSDPKTYINRRTEGYFILRDWLDKEWLMYKKDAHGRELVKQLEKIKIKHRATGKLALEPKEEMRKKLHYSPDDADSLMMGVWAIVNFIGKSANGNMNFDENMLQRIKSKSKMKHRL